MTKLLFFDDTQLLEKWNVERCLGQPSPVDEATFQVPEIDLSFSYPTVFPNPETGGWRMLYQSMTGRHAKKRPSHFIPSLADSSDGIHWQIPDLKASVSPEERVLPNQVGPALLDRFGEWGPCYYDRRAEDPRHRIKGFVCKGHGPGTGKKDSWIVTSRDGVSWRDLGGVPLASLRQRPFGVCLLEPLPQHLRAGDPSQERRPTYRRDGNPGLDGVLPGRTGSVPDGLDPDLAELYGMPTFPYANLFIGLLWLYRTPHLGPSTTRQVPGRTDRLSVGLQL